jgi:SH3 domain-containing YSC84-like protein 1
MNPQKRYLRAAMSVVQAIVLLASGGVALAQTSTTTRQSSTTTTPSARAETAAAKHVTDAVDVVNRMAAESGMGNLLKQAKGVYIVPTYGRAALGVGVSGGTGVMLARQANGSWSDPAFYNTGGLSIGAQAGAEGGPIALVLMNDKAVNSFKQKNKFSLSADAGLTVVNWAKTAQGTAGTGDVVAWAGTKGLFGNVATIAIKDIRFNQKNTNAYYGKAVTMQDIIDGKVSSAESASLKQALATAAGGSAK